MTLQPTTGSAGPPPESEAATAGASPSGVVGCLMAGTAVALGAWAAHGLGPILTELYAGGTREVMGRTISDAEKALGDFRTGVTYQTAAAFGVLATVGWAGRLASAGRWLILGGGGVFAGSLYILALSGVRWWGAVTPLGGAAMLAGWGCLTAAAARGAIRPAGGPG